MRTFFVSLLACVFSTFLATSALGTIQCPPPGGFPYDPDNTYCQSFGFEIFGYPQVVEVTCDDYQGLCCYYMIEKYIGDISCCTNSNCFEQGDDGCLPFMDGGDDGWLWGVLTSDDSVWHCEGDEQYYPEEIYRGCNSGDPPQGLDGPPSFCGNCDDGDEDKGVCVAFRALFNPNLNPYFRTNAKFDCFPPSCWDTCGDANEALIICDGWKICGDPDCQTL